MWVHKYVYCLWVSQVMDIYHSRLKSKLLRKQTNGKKLGSSIELQNKAEVQHQHRGENDVLEIILISVSHINMG